MYRGFGLAFDFCLALYIDTVCFVKIIDFQEVTAYTSRAFFIDE